MLKNTNLYENRMFTRKVNAALVVVGKEVRVLFIKRVILTWEFREALEGQALLKLGADAIKKFTPSLGIPYLGVRSKIWEPLVTPKSGQKIVRHIWNSINSAANPIK